MNWADKLDSFGRRLLFAMGHNPDVLMTTFNPITELLKTGDFVEDYKDLKGFNLTSVCKAAVVCQMAVYDASGGPDGDGKRKGLRRQWYAWFKTRLAQPFSTQVGEPEFKDRNWNGRMSQVYSCLVDNAGVTYCDLWVDDASRMMERWHARLFSGCHIVIAVEKDSLFSDFKAAASALGAVTLVSGKGKQSKAATEKMLREHFGWRPDYQPFSQDEPLIVLHISDHDCDGEAVIGPTFGEQARRYTEHILEARVGIKPENVSDWPNSWYEVKVTNAGYVRWAEREGLFMAECVACGHKWPVKGIGSDAFVPWHECPTCSSDTSLVVKLYGLIVDQPHGLEVEAMPTRNYYKLLVDALLQVLPFDYILSKLRDECTADPYDAAQRIRLDVLENNKSYQALLREFDRLEEIKSDFEYRIHDQLAELGDPLVHDWRNDDEDPEPEAYRQWVHGANDYTGPWRPFRKSDRTEKLVEHLREAYAGTISDFEQEEVEF